MKLQNIPFCMIRNKIKTIEIRLNDEKRSLIKIGDTIELLNIDTNEKLLVEVLDLHKFNTFTELYENIDKTLLGYKKNEIAKSSDMEKYYSKEEQERYKVVGIEIKLI